MQNLSHAEKGDLWGGITFIFAAICAFLAVNQMVPPAVDAMIPTILPKWALWLNLSLMSLSGINSFRHARKSDN